MAVSKEGATKRKRWPWVVVGIFALLIIIGAALPGKSRSPATAHGAAQGSPTQSAQQVRSPSHPAKGASRSGKPKPKPECQPFPKCKREAEAVEAEVKKGEQYERTHRPEQEEQEKEYERRARGELTPEEEKNHEAKQKEVEAEVETIREGRRLREEGK
jgi:hypothetical protein